MVWTYQTAPVATSAATTPVSRDEDSYQLSPWRLRLLEAEEEHYGPMS